MAGEIEATGRVLEVLPLRDHLAELRKTDVQFLRDILAALELRLQQRFDAQEKSVGTALIAAEKAVNAALTAAEKAVTKAEVASEKRFDNVNEFRATLADQAAQLMPRLEAENRLSSLADRLVDVEGYARAASERRAIVDTSVNRITALENMANTMTERVNQMAGNDARLDVLERALAASTGRAGGITASWGLGVIVVGLVFSLVGAVATIMAVMR